MSGANQSIALGESNDDELRDAIRETLRDWPGQIVSHWRGVAGSVELERLVVELGGDQVLVEAENYEGITLTGPTLLVTALSAEIQRRYRAPR